MRSKLPSLPITLAILSFGLVLFGKQPTAQSQVKTASASKKKTYDHSKPAGGPDQLIETAIVKLGEQASISAQIRQRVDLFGQTLIASGQFLQGPAGKHLVRLEMRITLGEQQGSIQQVCDGKLLWTYRQLGESSSLETLDVHRVAELISTYGAGQGGAPGDGLSLLAIDGMSGYLRELARNFQFRSVATSQLHNRPVWRLDGTWRAERLAKILPRQAERIAKGKRPDLNKLPEHVPHNVTVYLDRADGVLRRVDFLRSPPTGVPLVHRKPVVMASIEWLDVQLGAAIDARQFVYDPGRRKPKDVTAAYLQRHGLTTSR